MPILPSTLAVLGQGPRSNNPTTQGWLSTTLIVSLDRVSTTLDYSHRTMSHSGSARRWAKPNLYSPLIVDDPQSSGQPSRRRSDDGQGASGRYGQARSFNQHARSTPVLASHRSAGSPVSPRATHTGGQATSPLNRPSGTSGRSRSSRSGDIPYRGDEANLIIGSSSIGQVGTFTNMERIIHHRIAEYRASDQDQKVRSLVTRGYHRSLGVPPQGPEPALASGSRATKAARRSNSLPHRLQR